MLDIIIPVLNEERILIQEAPYYKALSRRAGLIFVDGGSRDRTAALAGRYGTVVSAPQGRAVQKNSGANASRSPYLLFMHVDTLVPLDALRSIERTLDSGAVAGCLTMAIQDKRFIFRLWEWMVNVRSRLLGVIDGDLGMFIRRDAFNRLGQFDPLPEMEDIVFSGNLRKMTRMRVLRDRIVVSSRKWHTRGFGQTFKDYAWAYLRFWTDARALDGPVTRTIHK